MSTQTALDFPRIQFMRMTRAEVTGIKAMISDARTKGRDLFAEQVANSMSSDVMTLAQFDALMGVYRHWLNWGFEPAPQGAA